jgi:ABC-2 type transport system permease protein
MHQVFVNTHNEIVKLLGQTKTKISLALTALVPVLAAIALGRLEAGIGLSLGRGLPQLMLDLFAAVWLPLFLFMAAAETFSGEYAARTIKLVLLRPLTRAAAFASKVLALLAYAASLLAAVGVASVAAGLARDARTTIAGLPETLLAYIAAFVAMAAVVCTAAFVAQWLRSGVGALTLCVFLYVAAKLLPFVWPEAAVWSLFAYTDWHTLWIGGAASAGKLLQAFSFLLSGCALTYTAGWYLFERKSF